MPNLVYTIASYTPFTKILSANANQDKTDIQSRVNWSGTVGDATTGLDGTNIQSNTAVAETKATVTTQGITATANPGWGSNGNTITIAFTAGVVAGSEVVTVTGTAISVQISTGVSTVTQVRTALSASPVAATLAIFTGTSASTVATASAVNLAGGVSGGGLSRSAKLALDTAGYVVVNNSQGQMSSVASLPSIAGGTGLQINPAAQQPGDVLQVNTSSTGLILGPAIAIPASVRLFAFYNYS